MQVPAREQQYLRFGPFTLDLVSHELWNDGHRVHLQEKPFEILVVLMERPGELVTRDELRDRLWPSDTFVDFEHSINTAIKKLRDALNDHAEDPVFIETLPKRGYRFITKAEETNEDARSAPLKEIVAPATPQTRIGYRRYALLGVVAFAAVAMLVGLNLSAVRDRLRPGKISEQDTIVIADFSNSTGDPVFDGTLKEALRIALQQSPFLNVLAERKVAAIFRQMARPAGTVLTHEVIRELCQRAGSKAYVAGSIARLDSEYALGLKAVNCQSGQVLAKELATVPTQEQVLNALGKAAARIRAQLGESLATVQKSDVPLAAVTTSSLEALKAFSLGAAAAGEQGPDAALSFDQRAIQLDPNFALAYLSLGADYLAMNQPGRASEYFARAFELRDRADERERLSISALYYWNVTGELDHAAQVLQQRIASYPREVGGYINLGNVYNLLGQHEKAADAYRERLRRTPGDIAPYDNLANTLLALQRFDDARQLIREAHSLKLDDYMLRSALYALAFCDRDLAAMTEQQRWFAGKGEETLGFSLASDTEAYAGRLGKARELSKLGTDSAIRADSKETAAIWQENAALREAAFGNVAKAKQAATEGMKLAPASQGVAAEAALAFAMAGDTARAESMAQELNRRFPLDTQMQSLWLPVIRAQVALHRKLPAVALKHLAVATGPRELGQITFITNLSCLYPTYVRGEAYLLSGQGNAAAAEFQKILDHNGLVWNCWTGALARLGVARANALEARSSRDAEADAARARSFAAYKDFLTLWKDADPDLTILKQAQAEYAKLH